MHLPAALLCAVLAAISGRFVPLLIARVPEPAAADADEPAEAETADATEEPKELYTDIAAHPGLARKCAVAAAVCGALVGGTLGWDWALLFLVPLVPIGVALAVIDWRTRLLPTRILAPTYVLVIALVLVCAAVTRDTGDLLRAGLGWLVAGGLFLLLWFIHPRGMGYGDVRLSGILGIALGYLGWGPLLVGVYAGFLLGGLGGGLLSALRIVKRKAFPFGPFMLIGALLGILVGAEVLGHLAPGLT